MYKCTIYLIFCIKHLFIITVFNDGDVTCLKRSALYLKTGRDCDANSKLSLTQLENNGTQMRNVGYGRRNRQQSTISG